MKRSLVLPLFMTLFSSYAFAECKVDSTVENNADFECHGQLAPTVYYTPIVNLDKNTLDENVMPACGGEIEKREVLHTDGKVILTLCLGDQAYKSFIDQGAFRIDQMVEGKPVKTMYTHVNNYRFMEVKQSMHNKCPYGLGHVGNMCLDPFNSVAADINNFPAGTVIYLPDVKGAILPDGRGTHTGFFVVRDIGGDIKNMRFDFFTGFKPWQSKNNAFTTYGKNKLMLSDPRVPYDFYIVKGATAEAVVKDRNYPYLKKFVPAEVKK